MDTAQWWVFIAVIFVALMATALFLKSLIDRLITLVDNLNDKVSALEGETKPILRDVELMMRDLEPLTKEIGDRSEEIGRLLANIERISDDAQATTGAIRNGIVPVVNTVAGMFSGLQAGARAVGVEIEPDEK